MGALSLVLLSCTFLGKQVEAYALVFADFV